MIDLRISGGIVLRKFEYEGELLVVKEILVVVTGKHESLKECLFWLGDYMLCSWFCTMEATNDLHIARITGFRSV